MNNRLTCISGGSGSGNRCACDGGGHVVPGKPTLSLGLSNLGVGQVRQSTTDKSKENKVNLFLKIYRIG